MLRTIDPSRPDGRLIRSSLFALVTVCLGALSACGGGGSSTGSAPRPEPTGGGGSGGSTPPAAATTIDVLALVTESAATIYPNPLGRVTHLVNVTNDILAANATNTRINLKHVTTVSYPDGPSAPTALDDLTFANHAAFGGVAALRNAQAADVVVLFRPYANDGYCGFAWVGGMGTQGDFSNPQQANFAYSVVSLNCSDYVLLHEIGHNMGLVHSRRDNPDGGSFSYGAGYGVDNVFATIMAPPNTFNAPQLPVLSSPSRNCSGYPCGVAYTDPSQGAEAARALMQVAAQIAAYR